MTKRFLILALVTGCGGAVEQPSTTWEGPASADSFLDTSSSGPVFGTDTSDTYTTTTVPVSSTTTDVSTSTVPVGSSTEVTTTTVVTTVTDSTEAPSTAPSTETFVDPTSTDTTEETTSDEASTTEVTTTTNVTEETTNVTEESTTVEETSTDSTEAHSTETSAPETTTSDVEETTTEIDTTTTEEETTTEEPVVLVCTPNAACADDNNPCTNDICSADGMVCNHPSKANGTTCGSASSSACDSPDSCQAGQCAPNPKPAGTNCDTDSNVCTSNTCNGAGQCDVKAAPANTVCDTATCSDGTETAAATCGGQTTCPAEREFTECFGTCNAQGTACEVPGIEQVYTSSNAIQQLSGNSTDLFFVENGAIRKLSKASRTVSDFDYEVEATTQTLELYPSENHMLVVESFVNNATFEHSVYCVATTGGQKNFEFSLSGASNVGVTMDGSTAYMAYSVITGGSATSALRAINCSTGVAESVYTTDSYTIVVGKPAVTGSSIYLALMDWSRPGPYSYGQRLIMLSKNTHAVMGYAEDMTFVKTSNPNQNTEVAVVGNKVMYRNPNAVYSIPVDVALDNGLLTEEIPANNTLDFPRNVWTEEYVYNMHFRRTDLQTGNVDLWTQFEFLFGLHIQDGVAYFHSNCWEASDSCNDAIYSVNVE